MQWHDYIPIVAAVITLSGVLLAPELGRRAGKKQVEAALLTADAEMKKAVSDERDSASTEWARITEAMQKWNESLASRLGEVERRLGDAEIRTAAADLKADIAERNYRIAIVYLRRVILWIQDNWPGETYPDPPPELAADL